MSNQEKRSFNQIFKKEYKLIVLFTLVITLIPLISEFVVISDINNFRELEIVQQLGVLVGQYSFQTTDLRGLAVSGVIVSTIALPFIASIMAHRLSGESSLEAINNGLSEIKSKRFWNFNVKVYLPYIIVITILIIAGMLIPESLVLSLTVRLIDSALLKVMITVLLVIISLLFSTIAGTLFVLNIAYMRGSNSIREVLQIIPSREITKLLIFNFTELLVTIITILCFVLSIWFMTITTLIENIFTISILFIVTILVIQIVFLYLRLCLYMNIGSKIEIQNNKSTEYEKKQKFYKSSVIAAPIATEQYVNSTQLSIKPKSYRRKDRFTNKLNTENKKVKRSIK